MAMRITGMSTGIDTDAAIKEMMKAQRMPYDRLLQKRQIFEWQRDQFRDMNRKLTDYRNNKLFNFRLTSTFQAQRATVTGNTAALTATTSATSTPQTFNINVTTLATAATKNSTGDITGGDPTFNPNAKLVNMGTQLGGFTNSTFSIKINDKTVNVNVNNDSLNDVLNRITSQTNVSAFYDSASGKVSFTAKESGLVNGAAGNEANITFLDDGNFLADNLDIDVAGAGGATAATNAALTINGMATTRTSNTFEINGTTINLLQAGGAQTTVRVGQDVTSQVNKIKEFITDYNDMLKTLQDKIVEPKYRSFKPLTAEEKEAMKESDIEKYEEKAQSGLLRNDSVLTMVESKMRTLVLQPVETGSAKYRTLSSIGITTGAYQDKGKLQIKSEAKLRQALQEDPDAVIALFNKAGNGDSNVSDTGIANRLYDSVRAGMDLIRRRAGTFGDLEANSFLGNQIFKLNKEITKKQEFLVDVENKLYKQFAAMERAMSNFNAQSSYLGNNIAAMNNAR